MPTPSRYKPHQNDQEQDRRVRQILNGQLTGDKSNPNFVTDVTDTQQKRQEEKDAQNT